MSFLRIHYHLLVSALFGAGFYGWLRGIMPHDTAALIAWDGAVIVYLFWMVCIIRGIAPTEAAMRVQAKRHDEGRSLVLVLATGTALWSLCAIALELMSIGPKEEALPYVLLAVGTVICSWFFLHLIFALHYAHIYYDENPNGSGVCGGLDFPGNQDSPDYWDFLYFSFIIGTSAQTADVGISSRSMRRICTIHCVIAFFFNTMVLALTINAASGLFER